MNPHLVALASQPWPLIWSFIGVAAVLTVVGIVLLRKSND